MFIRGEKGSGLSIAYQTISVNISKYKHCFKKKKKKVAKVAEAKLQLEIMEKPEKPVAVKVRI